MIIHFIVCLLSIFFIITAPDLRSQVSQIFKLNFLDFLEYFHSHTVGSIAILSPDLLNKT